MSQIQKGDFSISYVGEKAHVYDWLNDTTFIGKEYPDRLNSLVHALQQMQEYRDDRKKNRP